MKVLNNKSKRILFLLVGVILIAGIFYSNWKVNSAKNKDDEVTKVRVNISGGKVNFRKTTDSSNEIVFKYSGDKFTVSTSIEDGEQMISVKAKTKNMFRDYCVIYIPDRFTNMSITTDNAGVDIKKIYANMDIELKSSSSKVKLPSNYKSNLKLSLKNSSGMLILNKVDNYSIKGSVSNGSISLPKEYDIENNDNGGKVKKFSYTKGTEGAGIVVNTKKSSMKIED